MKSLGITFAFFGMVATVAALADLNTGRYPLQTVEQMMRAGVWVVPGLMLVGLGMGLVRMERGARGRS